MSVISISLDRDAVEGAQAELEREIRRVPTMNHYGGLRRGKTEVAYPATEDLRDLVVTSRLDDGTHSPVLDVDFPVTVMPSSTPGHHHLYLDGLRLPWWRYRILLRCLAWAGVIEKRYYRHSVRRKMTAVRLPHVHKVRRR